MLIITPHVHARGGGYVIGAYVIGAGVHVAICLWTKNNLNHTLATQHSR